MAIKGDVGKIMFENAGGTEADVGQTRSWSLSINKDVIETTKPTTIFTPFAKYLPEPKLVRHCTKVGSVTDSNGILLNMIGITGASSNSVKSLCSIVFLTVFRSIAAIFIYRICLVCVLVFVWILIQDNLLLFAA